MENSDLNVSEEMNTDENQGSSTSSKKRRIDGETEAAEETFRIADLNEFCLEKHLVKISFQIDKTKPIKKCSNTKSIHCFHIRHSVRLM